MALYFCLLSVGEASLTMLEFCVDLFTVISFMPHWFCFTCAFFLSCHKGFDVLISVLFQGHCLFTQFPV